jgi:hypothetical protein
LLCILLGTPRTKKQHTAHSKHKKDGRESIQCKKNEKGKIEGGVVCIEKSDEADKNYQREYVRKPVSDKSKR